jgi:hypothetical protein
MKRDSLFEHAQIKYCVVDVIICVRGVRVCVCVCVCVYVCMCVYAHARVVSRWASVYEMSTMLSRQFVHR